MLAIAFTFPAGRYHATPWGRHVNEADLAWPPDLWRITRALIAVWHRKLDASIYPVERLSGLLAALAVAGAPSYQLPAVAIHAHTRHYMPGRGDKRTLVFDAFARVANDAPIVIAWPELTLDSSYCELLDALLENLGYLGRAESWVEARRVSWPGLFNCLPSDRAIDGATGELQGEIVRLLSPQPPSDYAATRRSKLAAAGIALDANDAPPFRLSNKDSKLAATLPRDWLAALSVDTGNLQAAGWSSPPCAHSVSYRRPLHALQATAPQAAPRQRIASSRSMATTARFVLYGKPLPLLQDAVRVGEAMRRVAMGMAKRLLGERSLPPELSGHDLDAAARHGHAFWLPEDADGDGLIDHVLVHAPQGFSANARHVLTALQSLWRTDAEPLRLMLEGIGPCSQFGEVSRQAGKAAVWRSVTPYLHPWHFKKPQLRSAETRLAALTGQLRREWELRGAGLPSIESVSDWRGTNAGGRRLEPVHFQRRRCKRGLSQPDTLGHLLELRFLHPVQGPLALGFGCHFGLGLFESALGETALQERS